ncbi:MAG: hypothetical protein OEV48_10430 [Acidobacteriota bacterium]|jgi:hypothetical protein|nr:hypothetical protein [Acidobacteriota bacterium]
MFVKRSTFLLMTATLVILGGAPGVSADDLTGADLLLCAPIEATRCTFEGCETDLPEAWNIPQFIEIDLATRRLQTTAASSEKRATPITTLVREDGHIVIQGIEGGRAFSFFIHELSGELNAAIAATSSATTVFAVCTPLPAVD